MEIALAFFLSLLFHRKLARAIFGKSENISLLTKNLPHLQIESSLCVRVSLKARGNNSIYNSIYSQHCSLWLSQIFHSPLSVGRAIQG